MARNLLHAGPFGWSRCSLTLADMGTHAQLAWTWATRSQRVTASATSSLKRTTTFSPCPGVQQWDRSTPRTRLPLFVEDGPMFELVDRAQRLAEKHLESALPRRFRHTAAVADRAQQLASRLLPPERAEVVVASA